MGRPKPKDQGGRVAAFGWPHMVAGDESVVVSLVEARLDKGKCTGLTGRRISAAENTVVW